MSEIQELRNQILELTRKFDQVQRCGLSGGQLRAQSISVMCSSRTRCNAGCLFCISRTTPEDETESGDVKQLDLSRLAVGLKYAERCGATHAILTGKADPLQESPLYLSNVIRTCAAKMPIVDMHTNGFNLFNGKHDINNLINDGLNMITVSIASFNMQVNMRLMKQKNDPAHLLQSIPRDKLLIRCSLVLNNQGVRNTNEVLRYIAAAKKAGAHQVVIRELWVPDSNNPPRQEILDWNKKNRIDLADIQSIFNELVERKCNVKLVRHLPWGTPVYDVDGMNVTFARCEESFNGGTLKSIVHKVDGHGYMDWDHNGSILY